MSRVGNQPISVPSGTKIRLENEVFIAEGPKGRVAQRILPECSIKIEGSEIQITRVVEGIDSRAKHGLMRALIANAVKGVSDGFTKSLDIVGVGYRGDVRGKEVHFTLGLSHPIVYSIEEGIEIDIDKNNRVTVTGADKQRVGQVAAEIRQLRPPDPYKAKGIRYVGEVVRRKVGKAGAR